LDFFLFLGPEKHGLHPFYGTKRIVSLVSQNSPYTQLSIDPLNLPIQPRQNSDYISDISP
jgi:hypothetical protein